MSLAALNAPSFYENEGDYTTKSLENELKEALFGGAKALVRLCRDFSDGENFLQISENNSDFVEGFIFDALKRNFSKNENGEIRKNCAVFRLHTAIAQGDKKTISKMICSRAHLAVKSDDCALARSIFGTFCSAKKGDDEGQRRAYRSFEFEDSYYEDHDREENVCLQMVENDEISFKKVRNLPGALQGNFLFFGDKKEASDGRA